MTVDSTSIARLVAEAAQFAVGAPIRRIIQARHDLIALELGRSGPWQGLLIDWSAEFGRIHLTAELPEPILRDERFGSALRRQIRGARIDAIEQIDFDRIVHLRLSNCEQFGPQSRRILIAELMGRHSNVVLIDEDERIVEAGRHVTVRTNRYRETLPGLAYVPPPEFSRVPPWQAEPGQMLAAAAAVADQPLGRWLRATWHGGSDEFVAEVCARAQVDADAALRAQPDGWAERVANQLRAIPEEAARLGPAWVYFDEAGAEPELAWPIDAQHLAGRRREQVASLSGAVATLQADTALAREIRQARERLLGAVREGERKAERVLTKRREAVERAEQAQVLRERGELLMAYLHQVPEGADEVTLPRFDGSGELTIPLDPEYSALENAQACFKRYKKGARLNEMAPRLLAAAQHELEYVRQVRTQIEIAEDLGDLAVIEEELVREGYISAAKAGKPRSAGARRGPRTTQTSDGYPVLYGRSGTENDEVLRAAQPDDLWLHVKDAAGPHVIIRTNSRPDEVPQSSIEEAARLAAALSSQRRDGKVAVDCTLAKNVAKPRRGRPGLAYYRNARTMVVDPTES